MCDIKLDNFNLFTFNFLIWLYYAFSQENIIKCLDLEFDIQKNKNLMSRDFIETASHIWIIFRQFHKLYSVKKRFLNDIFENNRVYVLIESPINLFYVIGLFLYPLKTLEKQMFWCFSGVIEREQWYEMV